MTLEEKKERNENMMREYRETPRLKRAQKVLELAKKYNISKVTVYRGIDEAEQRLSKYPVL